MQPTGAWSSLARFRGELYERALGRRKDTLFELMEAALVSPGPATTVRLSLAPVFHRRWPSAPDALAEGGLDVAQGQRLVYATLAAQPLAGRPLWALDGTVWPRPAAATSPERTWGHRVAAGQPQTGVVPAWEYPWLVAVPEATGRWVVPLDVPRRGVAAGTPTELAIEQRTTALGRRPAGAPRPVVTADSGYDPLALAQARLAADLLVRLAPQRRFYRPPPYAGRGAPRQHGAVFKLGDPATRGPPERRARDEDAQHGTVAVAVWTGLHAQAAPATPLTLVRVQVARLPKSGKTPQPLWRAWAGAALPGDLLALWHGYRRRFPIEHAFRFLKQELGWPSPRPQAPAAADRWSWLLALALWQLWRARERIADQRLPWERPRAGGRRPPGRGRRAFGGLLAALGSPVRAIRPRGKSPGRQPGERAGRRPRHSVAKRRTKVAA